jgi:integrase
MRQRHQAGGLRKQRGRWLGTWWEGGKRKSRVLGLVKDMTKSKAREEVARLVAESNAECEAADKVWHFGEFVEQVFFPYYCRKWKASTRGSTMNRIAIHLVADLNDRELSGLTRDELQDLLDLKAGREALSYSTVAHLRWDLKQVFDMAVAEGHIARNPALLLFTPKDAKRTKRAMMTGAEVQTCFRVLGPRERLIAKLAILAGMRPGEIFALTWGEMTSTYANIRQRVYRGVIDSPKTAQSFRRAALSDGLLREIEDWRKLAPSTAAHAWVFPSERMTPMAKENVWRRWIGPKLEKAGLGWVNFQVMRRTHASLMSDLGVEGKLVADQLGHSLDVNQNVYTQSAVSKRQTAVNMLENSLNGVQMEFTVSTDSVSC